MGYSVSSERMDEILNDLKKDYQIFAPRRFENRGWKPGTDLIRYAEINSISEIVFDEKSDFSPKEVFYPILQTLFYFDELKCRESSLADDRGILIFARPCDINGIRRLDKIFLENGGRQDNYYQRLREKLKFVMIECKEGWESCFCVSMDSNRTNDYSLAVRVDGDGLLIEINDAEFQKYFAAESLSEFKPDFPENNFVKVSLPDIKNTEDLKRAYNLELWSSFNTNCISCGACNTVCITCSCFDTTDIIYNETSRDGERRRVWSSCMVEDFSTMAGGHNVRKTAGERMRFRTLHKVYDYKARFEGAGNMCVGCGRCSSRCPQEISFSDTINQMSEEMAKTAAEVKG